LAFVLAAVTGCPEPSDLEDPDQYPAPLGAPAPAAKSACETPCALALLGAKGCGVCHTKDAPAAFSRLDLSSPSPAARLLDVPAQHLAEPPLAAGACPTSDKLIDSAAPENSWLLKKITGQDGACGDPMPGVALADGDLKCLEDFVACVAAK
jgi:hypothetical protein